MKDLTISDVNGAILYGNFSNTELNSIMDAIRFARTRLVEQTKRSLRVGDNVNFTSTKTGQNVTGLVTKVAIKYVTVKTVNGLWRVPANMLTKVEDREFA